MDSPDGAVKLCRALADATRMRVLLVLAAGERNVGKLQAELGMPQPTVSHHLSILRRRGLVAARRSGKNIYYDLDDKARAAPGGGIQIGDGHITITVSRQ